MKNLILIITLFICSGSLSSQEEVKKEVQDTIINVNRNYTRTLERYKSESARARLLYGNVLKKNDSIQMAVYSKLVEANEASISTFLTYQPSFTDTIYNALDSAKLVLDIVKIEAELVRLENCTICDSTQTVDDIKDLKQEEKAKKGQLKEFDKK